MTESLTPAFFQTPLTGSVRHVVRTAQGAEVVRVTRAALVKLAEGDNSRSSVDIFLCLGQQVDDLCRGLVAGKVEPAGGWLLDAADVDRVVPLAFENVPPARYFDAPAVGELIDPAFKAWLESNPRRRPIAEYIDGDVLLSFDDDADRDIYGARKDDGTWVQFLDGEEIPLDGSHPTEPIGNIGARGGVRVPTHFYEIPFEAAVTYMML